MGATGLQRSLAGAQAIMAGLAMAGQN